MHILETIHGLGISKTIRMLYDNLLSDGKADQDL